VKTLYGSADAPGLGLAPPVLNLACRGWMVPTISRCQRGRCAHHVPRMCPPRVPGDHGPFAFDTRHMVHDRQDGRHVPAAAKALADAFMAVLWLGLFYVIALDRGQECPGRIPRKLYQLGRFGPPVHHRLSESHTIRAGCTDRRRHCSLTADQSGRPSLLGRRAFFGARASPG